jgi:hypothetical protein
MVLPTNIDSTYADDASDPSQKLHQQYHDSLHTLYNTYEGTAPANFATAAQGALADSALQAADLTAHTGDASAAHAASAVSYAGATNLAATDVEAALDELDTEKVAKATFPVLLGFALSDETTAITTGTAKLTARAPFAFTLTGVRASLTTASSSGIPTVDINEGGTTVLSTKLTIDANEKTSTTAATAAVISDSAIADDAELTFDIDVAGTGATGLKVWLIGTRVLP